MESEGDKDRVGRSDKYCVEQEEYSMHVCAELILSLLLVTVLPHWLSHWLTHWWPRIEHNHCSTRSTWHWSNCPPEKNRSHAMNSHFMVFTATFWEVPSSCFRFPSITDPNSPVKWSNIYAIPCRSSPGHRTADVCGPRAIRQSLLRPLTPAYQACTLALWV